MNTETFFHSLLQHWPGAFFRQRVDMSCAFVSPGLEEMTGVSLQRWHADSTLFWQIVDEGDAEKVRAHLDVCRQVPFGVNCHFHIRHSGTDRLRAVTEYRCRVHEGGQLAGYDCVWLEGAAAAAAEKRLTGASWKETVGLMTMGLAHDYNNVLAGVLPFTELLLAQIDAAHPFHEGLTLVHENSQKGAQLIRQIVQLHQAKFNQPTYHELNEILTDALDLLRKAVPRRIEISSRLSSEPLPIFVDALELRQVISNFFLNAAEAMPAGGKLAFTTSLHSGTPSLGYFVGTTPRSPCVCLEVSDTGGGIAPEDLFRLFDPFFTTKFANRGTGLGLHTARLFAGKYHGAISVESAPGAGTAFRLWLPQADFTEAEQALEFSRQRPRRLLLTGGSATALKSLADFWRANDFEVVIGLADTEAILLAGEHEFDALLLAVESGDAQPLALANRVRQQKLPLKIIVQPAGDPAGELAAPLLAQADLILPPDLPPAEQVRKVSALLE